MNDFQTTSVRRVSREVTDWHYPCVAFVHPTCTSTTLLYLGRKSIKLEVYVCADFHMQNEQVITNIYSLCVFAGRLDACSILETWLSPVEVGRWSSAPRLAWCERNIDRTPQNHNKLHRYGMFIDKCRPCKSYRRDCIDR